MGRLPPLWLVAVTQAMSVCGDAFGQRVARVDFKSSRRRMMMMMSVVTAVQIFVLLGIVELTFPRSITGPLYIDDKRATCYRETDIDHRTIDCGALANTTRACTEIECPAQGPFTFWAVVAVHPLVLLNGVLDLAYYTAEFQLYREAFGLLLLVIASLASSFLVGPVGDLFHLPKTKPIAPFVYILGIGGALLTLVERTVVIPDASESSGPAAAHETSSINAAESQPLLKDSESGALSPQAELPAPSLWRMLRRSLGLAIPFTVLSIVYALYFVTQVYFNDRYRLNVYGYTSVDQVLLPFFVYPYLFLIDVVPALKRAIENETDQKESFGTALRGAWGDLNIFTMFMYRLLINGRAMIYFYLSVQYDLSLVYLELTLMRIMFSWLGSIVLILLVPRLIRTNASERATALHPLNLVAKAIGSAAIVLSLLILNKVI
eukprot:Amastigsp_a340038_90.p1 type:complete len:435 gc:universal Amastigsp_a340038_90:43-1347(+)